MRFLILMIGTMIIPFHSCTTSHKMGDNQKSSGHFRLYSFPEKYQSPSYDKDRYKKLVFVSSNDFNGNIFPKITPIPNRFKENRLLKSGGITAARAYLDIFEKTFGNKMLYVDAGSFLNPSKNHRQTLFFYKYLDVDLVSLGVNELMLDLPPQTSLLSYLNLLASQSNFEVLNTNLFDLSKAEQVTFSGSPDFTIREINGLKVGFISALTSDIAKMIPDKKINGLYIQNPVKNIISKSTLLRRQGAHVIVLLASQGIDCTSRMAHSLNLPEKKVNFDTTDSSHCDTYKNELFKILTSLPEQTIDLAISSGKKSKVANFINNIPVIQNFGQGQYLSWAELYFDTKHRLVVPTMTKLHQPVQLCHNFLAGHQDCYSEENINDAELAPALFFGEKVQLKDIPKTLSPLE